MSKYINLIFLIFFLALSDSILAQKDSLNSKFNVHGDFRFRAEQDWNSRKSDGTYRQDRTRLRYRVRLGVTYDYNEAISIGFRIRTGNPIKQQDPQLTLGGTEGEFGTLPIGIERAYLKGEISNFEFWIGKNTFPFKKQNELFWSDHVYPEGVSLSKEIMFDGHSLNSIKLVAGHFIIRHGGSSLGVDNYFQGFQSDVKFLNNRMELFPSIYLFRNTPNVPDGGETYVFDYSIFHIGYRIVISKHPLISLEADFYKNLEDYSKNDSIHYGFKNQNAGINIGFAFGKLVDRGDWLFKFTYNYQQQYSLVDFMAQNDWARWDYSSQGSPDGRLSNYKGFELVSGYSLGKNFTLRMKYYHVNQLVPYGNYTETGSRIRFDVDIGF
ncbi:MAG: putative porin [Reichenbachiella sp.]